MLPYVRRANSSAACSVESNTKLVDRCSGSARAPVSPSGGVPACSARVRKPKVRSSIRGPDFTPRRRVSRARRGDLGCYGKSDIVRVNHQKPIVWMGSSKRDLGSMEEDVQDAIGY